MENTDIQKAVTLLREIDAWLSFNQAPNIEQLKDMRTSIKDFTSHFPECWKCGDTGCIPTYDDPGGKQCLCNITKL